MKLTNLFLIAAFALAPVVGVSADTMEQKLEYQKKVETQYTQLKKDVEDAKERIDFAIKKNRKQMKYVVKKMKKELDSVGQDIEGLRSAAESEWSTKFKPKLDDAFKDLNKEWAEVKGLMSDKETK